MLKLQPGSREVISNPHQPSWESLRKRGQVTLAVCLAFLAACRLHGAIDPHPTVPESVGVNIHFLDPQPGEMKMLAATGVRWVRMDFDWSRIEKARGQYDFTAYDRLMAVLEQQKIRPLFILDYANALYDNGLSPYTDEGVQAFAQWAAASVTHFKGRRIVWEMYNEPNFFWRPKPDVKAYIRLALTVGEAIYEAAPGEDYIGPATSGVDLPFLEACFKAGLLNYWSAVSVHPYRGKDDPETAVADFRALRTLIRRYAPEGRQIPILSGEWGYSSNQGPMGMDEETQGKLVARQWLSNVANDVAVSIWYDWRDDGPDPKEREHHFGLVRFPYDSARDPVYGPKPAYKAARTLTTSLGGFSFNKRLVVGGSNDFALLFNKGSAMRLAVWTTAAAHPVTIPASPGRFRVTTHTGQQARALTAGRDGLTVVATDAPQYLEPEKPNDLLRVAAAWTRAPLEIPTTGPQQVSLTLRLRNPLPRTLRLRSEGGAPAVATSGQEVSLTTTAKVTRAAELVRVPIVWEVEGLGRVAQETEILVTNPLGANLSPVAGQVLPVGINNPSGEAFQGEVVLTDVEGLSCGACATEVELRAGETASTVTIVLQASAPGYRAGLMIKDSRGVTVLRVPPTRLVSTDDFSRYPSGGQPEAYQLVPETNAKVATEQALSVAAPPEGPPFPGVGCLRIAYRLPPGRSVIRLTPVAERAKVIQGEPSSFGLWVYGDGQGAVLGLRFVDETGQMFQEGGRAITWKGWHYAVFPMSATMAAPRGGAGDGLIHYPIRWDTLFLISNTGDRETQGAVFIGAPTLMF